MLLAARPIVLATKTLNLIELVIQADQGASYRKHLGVIIPTMHDAYRSEAESFRSHMGASLMGGKCGRSIWYSFRWATKSNFTGRIQRLFNRGHLEEARFIACLLAIGVTVYQQDENGKQYRITGSYGHYGGSGDGIGVNIPDLPPGVHCVLEFKTHNDASFKALQKSGVRNTKFEHMVQMQQYMRKMGIQYSLYMAVNKNNDELYAEIITLDVEMADMYIERADKIIWMRNAPTKIGSPPSVGNYDCKWCDHKPICFQKRLPAKNCRSCVNAVALESGDGAWGCLHPAHSGGATEPAPIPKEFIPLGCDKYQHHPDMGA